GTVSKTGGGGDAPAPVRDPPTGTAASNVAKRRRLLARTVVPVPSGESPDGTGASPVLPVQTIFKNRLSGFRSMKNAGLHPARCRQRCARRDLPAKSRWTK